MPIFRILLSDINSVTLYNTLGAVTGTCGVVMAVSSAVLGCHESDAIL